MWPSVEDVQDGTVLYLGLERVRAPLHYTVAVRTRKIHQLENSEFGGEDRGLMAWLDC